MAAYHHGPPKKRPRLDLTVKSQELVFKNAQDIRSALHTQDQKTLAEVLGAMRTQLTLRPEECKISLQDERFLLAQNWIESDPGVRELFTVWENTGPRQVALLSLVVSILSAILTLLNSHYTSHVSGLPVIKALLVPTCMRHLNSYLGGSNNELVLVTLKLMYNMSVFAGGKEKKNVLEGFAWELKSLPKLLNMRRRGKNEDSFDPLIKPDIRTLYILFIMSFIDSDSQIQIKTLFLEQHRDAVLSVFKGLYQDHYNLVRKVLEICWSGLWLDAKVKRTVKISLFNETTLAQLLKLYDRPVAENDHIEHVPADLVHHFLLAICTRPGVGTCFKDRGWYARESGGDVKTQDDEGLQPVKNGKIYNKILSNILKNLKVNEDPRQQELALKILSACPELVAGYWSSAALTLEPRLSSKWIANISFFASIISLPVPSPSFFLLNTTMYNPTPPTLHTIMENILPSVNTKAHFSKGLQSPSGLVQHTTALALARCLLKLDVVFMTLRTIASALEEDEEEGQWSRRRGDVEREARRRLPEFQVIVAFSQVRHVDGAGVQPIKAALLAESAQRLLWMYQRCLPSLLSEARFDVGKLLLNFSLETQPGALGAGESEAALRINHVRQLHVLRLLNDTDQFIWTGKAGSSSQNYFQVLLKSYTTVEIPAIRVCLSSLLQRILSESIMFEDKADEPWLWLEALPSSHRSTDAKTLDGAPLTDESESVIVFLDDCVHRCLKSPYKYIEELDGLSLGLNAETETGSKSEKRNENRFNNAPSPLLATVVEQLDAKLTARSFSASDVLALSSFVRKLIFYLASRLSDLCILREVVRRIDVILRFDNLFVEYPVISYAIRKEVAVLQHCISFAGSLSPPTRITDEVNQYLSQIEELPLPVTKRDSLLTAYGLVDWFRLLDQPLGIPEIRRVLAFTKKIHPPALRNILENIDPRNGGFWEAAAEIMLLDEELCQFLPFDWLFVHSYDLKLSDVACRRVLVHAVLNTGPALMNAKRAARLIAHGMAVDALGNRDGVICGSLELLADIIQQSAGVMFDSELDSLKETIFLHLSEIRKVMMSADVPDSVIEATRRSVNIALNPLRIEDQKIASDISTHWLNVLKNDLESGSVIHKPATLWLKYLGTTELLDLLDNIIDTISVKPETRIIDLLSDVLSAIVLLSPVKAQFETPLRIRLPKLLSLQVIVPESRTLQDMIATAIDSTLPAFYDGRILEFHSFGENSLSSYVQHSTRRWSLRLAVFPELHLDPFLMQQWRTDATARIVSGILYGNVEAAHPVFEAWLAKGSIEQWEDEHAVRVLCAFLDVSRCSGRCPFSRAGGDTCMATFLRLLRFVLDPGRSRDFMVMVGTCVVNIFALDVSRRAVLCETVVAALHELPDATFTLDIVEVGMRMYVEDMDLARGMVVAIIDKGMQWVIRQLAADADGDVQTQDVLHALNALVKLTKLAKSHLVETLMTVVVHDQLSNVAALNLGAACLSVVSLKPLIVNRQIQSIIQHPHFFKLTAAEPNPARTPLISVLKTLFYLHPVNTCQASHIEPLIKIYRGTLSFPDIQLLSIFQLFESQLKISVAPLLSLWSASPSSPASSTPLEALQSLDPIHVLRTLLHFPIHRPLHQQTSRAWAAKHEDRDEGESGIYDPVFLMLLFGQMLVDGPPASAFAWVELFRTNVVCVFLRALSSRDDSLRDLALCLVMAVWKQLETADMQEKPHVLYIFTLVKNLYPPPTSEAPPKRLPSYTTLLVAHALRGIFYPSNFIYPLTARFLLQRPQLDPTDVPMLYSMLYSSGEDWKKERGWILRFLADGMASTADWRVLKRRHTWELLASLYQSTQGDVALRHSVLDVLANLTCNAQATTSLVLKSGLLTWIEMQLLQTKSKVADDTIAWTRILENILLVAEPAKMDASTGGEWRVVISRCLGIILGQIGSETEIFLAAVRVVLRLCMLSGTPLPGLAALLWKSVKCLEAVEDKVRQLPALSRASWGEERVVDGAGWNRARGLHDVASPSQRHSRSTVEVWGACVEMLWRASMVEERKTEAWDALSARLLLWRAIRGPWGDCAGAGGCAVWQGEWMRRESVRSIGV